jgi:hypothetical protein
MVASPAAAAPVIVHQVAAASNPFPDLDWTDRGTARLVSHRAPRSRVISDANDLSADGSVALAATFNGISRSTDGGRQWRSVLSGERMNSVTRGPTGYAALGFLGHGDSMAGEDFCGVSVYRSELWLMCDGGSRTWILRSDDAGRTWSGHGLAISPDTQTVVATGPGSAEFANAASIWRTVDGGATWRQSWPRLSGER